MKKPEAVKLGKCALSKKIINEKKCLGWHCIAYKHTCEVKFYKIER